MNHFARRRGRLFAEEVPLERIARAVGTPVYVYSEATLRRHFRVLDEAFAGRPHLLCYSVKACSNLAVLRLFASQGAGFDIVSGGELLRVAKATRGDTSKVVFSGVGKTEAELRDALAAGILMFNVESGEELEALGRVARSMRRPAPFSIRVNPHVDALTHRHIATGLRTSKFGVAFSRARELYQRSRKNRWLSAVGVDCHIGSQLTTAAPVRSAIGRVVDFYRALLSLGHTLRYLDVGGGLGITYREERPPSVGEYARAVSEPVGQLPATLIVEPGRVLVGNAAVLVTQVLYRKKTSARHFVVVDAGMNDLVRPALYDAHHEIVPLGEGRGPRTRVDVVGPVCESTDVLARGRLLAEPRPGDFLALLSAGAYGMSMASNYNSRPRPAEVMVRGGGFRVVRARERLEDLWRGERP